MSASSSSRRSLLKKGALGGVLLFAAGSLPIAFRPSGPLARPTRPLGQLTASEYGIFAAAATRLVLGNHADARWPMPAAVDCAGRLDDILSTLHPRATAEFRKLLRLFENGMTGLFSIGSAETFTAASVDEQDRRLQSWRHSRLALLRSGYQAMKRLAHATYYSSPATFAAVGYPGPPVVPSFDRRAPQSERPAAGVPG